MGGHCRRQGVDHYGSSLPHLIGYGVGSGEGQQDGVPEVRVTNQRMAGGWSKVWRSRGPYCLRLLLRVRWGEECKGRVLNGAFHRERQQSRDVVHPELGRFREERGAYEGRDRVRPYHSWGDFGVFMSRGPLWWGQNWVFGTRGVHRMASAATRGSGSVSVLRQWGLRSSKGVPGE